MNESSPKKRTLELAGRLCDEQITDEEFAELDTLLTNNESARTTYADFMRMHRRLEDGAFTSPDESLSPEKVVRMNPRRRLPWLTAAAALLALSAIILATLNTNPGESSNTPPPTPVLTRAIDVEWEHPRRFQAVPGEPITEKHLRLASGIAEITFSSGAVVTIQGPAKLRIDEPLHCFSHYGKLAANCPESAYGFTVRFPGGRVVDLGTEFAMESSETGKTRVQVLSGEVVVALTDENEDILAEKNLLEHGAVDLDPNAGVIDAVEYDDKSFAPLKRDTLLRSQPIKLQFDIGHRAGIYSGTNAPGHAAGDFLAHENAWTQIVGDQSGTFVMANGNICPHPIVVDYGHGDGVIDWDAEPVDPWGRIYSKAGGVFDSALCQDHRPWDFDLGLRISGLPKGKYRIYALCRSVRRPEASYDVSFGVNLDRQLPEPAIIPTMDNATEPTWVPGLTYAVDEVEVSGPEDWATFITRYSRERSINNAPHHGRSVLLGLQIVQIP
ncbi:MAG: hypothetical protein AAGD22_15965 [Verrucomicrobiota bacterium]